MAPRIPPFLPSAPPIPSSGHSPSNDPTISTLAQQALQQLPPPPAAAPDVIVTEAPEEPLFKPEVEWRNEASTDPLCTMPQYNQRLSECIASVNKWMKQNGCKNIQRLNIPESGDEVCPYLYRTTCHNRWFKVRVLTPYNLSKNDRDLYFTEQYLERGEVLIKNTVLNRPDLFGSDAVICLEKSHSLSLSGSNEAEILIEIYPFIEDACDLHTFASEFQPLSLPPAQPTAILDPETKQYVAACLLNAITNTALIVQTFHELGIVLRDLKPENILFLTNEGTIRLFDFSSARRLPPQACPLTPRGTLNYMAPELISPSAYPSPDSSQLLKMDVFSLGRTTQTLFYLAIDRLLALGHLHTNLPLDDAAFYVECLFSKNFPDIYQFVQELTAPDVVNRPTITETLDLLEGLELVYSKKDGQASPAPCDIETDSKANI